MRDLVVVGQGLIPPIMVNAKTKLRVGKLYDLFKVNIVRIYIEIFEQQ